MEKIIDKDKALKKSKKNQILEDWIRAKILRNDVGKLVERAKKEHFQVEYEIQKTIQKDFGEIYMTLFQKTKITKPTFI